MKNAQKKEELINPKIIEILPLFLLSCYSVLHVATNINLDTGYTLFEILMIILALVIFLIIPINIHHQNKLWEQERIDS